MSYKLVQTLDSMHLEMSYRAALLDKQFYLASLTIGAGYRGIRTRRALRQIMEKRRWAISYIQSFMRKRLSQMHLAREQAKAALLVQRYCRGHLAAKRYLKARGDISIAASLKTFRDMKIEIGTQLSNSIRFYWKVYLRKKANKKKKKKKGSTKKGKKTLSTKGTLQVSGGSSTMTASPTRRNTTQIVSQKSGSFKV